MRTNRATDIHDEAKSSFSQFWERVQKAKTLQFERRFVSPDVGDMCEWICRSSKAYRRCDKVLTWLFRVANDGVPQQHTYHW